MTALGIARLDDEELLEAAGADLVVTSLDEIDTRALAQGEVCARPNPGLDAIRDAVGATEDRDWVLSHQAIAR
jgi:hypothetical protein